MARHNELGKWGEDVAAERLRQDGFTIVERNWHSGHYEIDIVAVKDNRMVFAEVKTRSDDSVDPLDAIDAKKIRRTIKAADCYIRTYDIKHEPQFDVFAVIGHPGHFTVEHIKDAFFTTLE